MNLVLINGCVAPVKIIFVVIFFFLSGTCEFTEYYIVTKKSKIYNFTINRDNSNKK